jgi:hypothetical protein
VKLCRYCSAQRYLAEDHRRDLNQPVLSQVLCPSTGLRGHEAGAAGGGALFPVDTTTVFADRTLIWDPLGGQVTFVTGN